MKFGPMFLAIAVLVVVIILKDGVFVVNQNEQAVVLKFGKFVETVRDPGLHFKTPFIQQVRKYENRLMDYDSEPTEVITKDKRTLVIDNYAKWKIIDPERFFKRLRTESNAIARLDDIIYSELRQDFGRHTMEEIVSEERANLMRQVAERCNQKATELELGLVITDVRIKRADLPEENRKAVYARMRAERERIGRQFRSEGQEESEKIRAETDKEKVILLADAYQKEQVIRGLGDAQAIKIYAEAVNQDPEFYGFTRSLEAYSKALAKDTTLVLPDSSEFLRYLDQSGQKK